MRDPNQLPRSRHSVQQTVVGMLLTALLAPVFVLVVLYPVTAMGVVALGVGGLLAVRTLRRFYRTRQREGRTRQVCLPKTGVCVEM